MFKRQLTAGDIFLIFINLVPLFGVWFLGWDAAQMFLVYCMETIIAGLINILKMLVVTFIKKKDVWQTQGSSVTMVSGYFFIFFFIIHYGFFVAIQLMLFLAVSGMISDGMNPFVIFPKAFQLLDGYTWKLLLGFAVIYTIKAFNDFILSGEYKTISLGRLMFSPYIRIVIQQFVVITGSLFLQFGAGKIFMLIFVSAKIFLEVFVNYDRLLQAGEKKAALLEKMNRNKKEMHD